MKSILFRIPKDIGLDLATEMEFQNRDGQNFIEEVVLEKLRQGKRESDVVNARGETRSEIKKRLSPVYGEARDKATKKTVLRKRSK